MDNQKQMSLELAEAPQSGRAAILVIAAMYFLALPSGCESNHSAAEASPRVFSGAGPIHALCTTGMVADIVRNIGGDAVEVTQLMGEGVDPHLYKASTGDVTRLQRADIVFYSGLHLEGKLSELLARIGQTKPVYGVADAIPHDQLIPVPGGFHDPHVWFDVSLWKLAAQRARDVLMQFDIGRAAEYRQRADRYLAELSELDAYVRRRIEEIPPAQRVLVTAHDAFHYFGRAYGMEVKAIQGISTESEASVREINDLVDYLVAHRIKAVFVETSVSERNVKALVEGCRARGHDLRIGGELYSDAMGTPGTPQGTYRGMVEHNVQTIVEALK
jgi:manganese/zinc/iron transport system substrate-binding protein